MRRKNNVRSNRESRYTRYNSWWRQLIIKTVINRLSARFNYRPTPEQLPEGANLIVANHVTNADQFFFISRYPKDRMFFVAAEEIFKSPFIRWLAERVVGIIVHMRGANSFKTTADMLRHLKAGDNVGIFPEGSASFDGRTAEVGPIISKVAKKGNCNLIITRIEGGYLSKPRWRPGICKGRLELCDKILSRQQLAEMSEDEITAVVNEWIATDAYAEQAKHESAFVGKAPCLGLESCVYFCPKCGKVSHLWTDEDSIYCECGFKADYDEYGYLTDGEGKRHTVTELCLAQKEYLRTKLIFASTQETGDFLFEDDFHVNKVWSDGRREPVGQTHIKVYTDHAEYEVAGDHAKAGSFPLTDVKNLFIFQRNPWNCQIAGKEHRYEMLGDFSSNALKYKDLWDILNREK